MRKVTRVNPDSYRDHVAHGLGPEEGLSLSRAVHRAVVVQNG